MNKELEINIIKQSVSRYKSKSILLKLINKEDILDLVLFVLQDLRKCKTDKINVGLKKAKMKGVILGCPKGGMILKEHKIVELRKRGFIEDKNGEREKATYSRIANHLKVSMETVRKVIIKYELRGSIDSDFVLQYSD